MIVLFRTKKLAGLLRDHRVSEKEKLQYTIAFCLIFTLATCAFFPSPSQYNAYDAILDLLLILSAIIFPLFTYRINKNGDNEDFLTRYIALSVPIAMQTITIFIIPIIIGSLLDNLPYLEGNEILSNIQESPVPEVPGFVTGPFVLGVIVAMYMYMTWRYVAAFSIASGLKDKTHV